MTVTMPCGGLEMGARSAAAGAGSALGPAGASHLACIRIRRPQAHPGAFTGPRRPSVRGPEGKACNLVKI